MTLSLLLTDFRFFYQDDEETRRYDASTSLTTSSTVTEEIAMPIHVAGRRQSLFVPHEDLDSESDELPCVADSNDSRQQLNRFLQLRDVSPVCNALSVPWKTAKDRTKRRYLRKAEQSISAVLEVIAPGASQELWKELCDRHMHAVCKESRENVTSTSETEVKLLEAYAESYLNAQHWSTRRQILSLMADKLSLNELREFVPTVTSYRYNIARRHRLLHAMGGLLLFLVMRPEECELNLQR